jgi:hypothetical protein
MRDQLRKSGIATLPDADAKNEISKDQQDMIAAELALNGGNDNNGAASNGKE